MKRHVRLTEELRRCRYFTAEELSMQVKADKGVVTSWEQTLPDRGATRDMVGVLRQLFGDRERGGFASMLALLRRHAAPATDEGAKLLAALNALETHRQQVLSSWAVGIHTDDEGPAAPVDVFLDWLYGEFLHSDASRAEKIERLDGPYRLYEWQFHMVAERLAAVFSRLALIVAAALAEERLQPLAAAGAASKRLD